MTTSARRKVGIALVALSMVAMVLFLVVGFVRGQWHFAGSESSGNALWLAGSVKLGVSGYYLIPIVACGAMGALQLRSASRKPPKLYP